MNCKFYLKSEKKDKKTIFAHIEKDGMVFRYYLDESISDKFWNKKKQRAKESREFMEALELNRKLDRIENIILNEYRVLQNEGNFTKENLKENLDIVLRGKKSSGFNSFTDKFIKNITETKSKRTKQKFINLLLKLREFKSSIDFADFDIDFFNKFLIFLNNKNYSKNHISGIIATIKQLLREAVLHGFKININVLNYKYTDEQSVSIYLTIEELEQLYSLELKGDKEKARDLFLIGAFTGLRFSDFTRISKEYIKDNFIDILTIKTKQRVVIPLHYILKEILEKWNFTAPLFSKNNLNVMLNRYLKELGQVAGFDDTIIKTITKGGVRRELRLKKWEMLTTHTARRSFATNAFKSGIPAISIMKITGHTSERSFLKYIKISQQENAELIAGHSFFNKK